MYDIIFISQVKDSTAFVEFKKRFPFAKQASTFDEAKHKSFTKLFWLVWDDVHVLPSFKFSYPVPDWDQDYIHVFKNADIYDGICLVSKTTRVSEKEFSHRFFINKKEVDIVASIPVAYDIFNLNSYDEYIEAVTSSSTAMFWAVWNDVLINPEFKFDYYIPAYDVFHRNITHVFLNDKYYDGICLFSKTKTVSKNEFNNRFFVNKKEVDTVASTPKPYDVFFLKTYDNYLEALETSTTDLFWHVPSCVTLVPDFKFDFYISYTQSHDKKINHVLKNGNYHDGVTLFSKASTIGKREFDYRFLINKKEHDIIASTPNPYDIVYISYNEVNADANFKKLKEQYPRALRVHGVKGIHQAHIEAAKLVSSEMFWVVDADALVNDAFKFDYQVAGHDKDIVHVWKSQNPINGLEYGNGGVKLLPTKLTLNMNTSKPDMTTSISPHFKAMPDVSNITLFNTDPFNTWKSAFRECVKLASKTIQGQVNEETDLRLDTWCTVGSGDYSGFAILGALAGRKYGQENAGNIPALSLINDFDWLTEQFASVSPPLEK